MTHVRLVGDWLLISGESMTDGPPCMENYRWTQAGFVKRVS